MSGQRPDLFLYIHDIGARTYNAEQATEHFEAAISGGYRALEAFRKSGAIAVFGLDVNENKSSLTF